VVRIDQASDDVATLGAAVAAAKGSVLALLSDEVEVKLPDWLGEMVSLALQPGVGAVGARLWYPTGALQHAGVVLGVDGVAGYSHRGMPPAREGYCGRAALIQSMSAVSGACLVVQKDHYQQVGGMDTGHLKDAFADVDLCLRLREAGLRNVWTPYAELIHHASTWPAKPTHLREGAAYMRQRWAQALLNDPAYSPNLTLQIEDFSYAWPSRAPWFAQATET
jgi:GT2 family glycosyltransferase